MVQVSKPVSNVDDAVYTLRIGRSQTVIVDDFNSGEKVERIEFTFLCTDGPSEGEKFTDLFTPTVGKRAKLGRMYRAAMKTEIVPDDWDTDDLDGKFFQALVQANDSGYPRISSDSIKPAKERPRRPRPASEGTPVGQTAEQATRKANLRQAANEDADDDTWEDETNEDAA